MDNQNYTGKLITILGVLLFLVFSALSTPIENGDKIAEKIEAKADYIFNQEDFEKAMSIYERIFEIIPDMTAKYESNLHIKVAHLYTLLNDTASACKHIELGKFSERKELTFEKIGIFNESE